MSPLKVIVIVSPGLMTIDRLTVISIVSSVMVTFPNTWSIPNPMLLRREWLNTVMGTCFHRTPLAAEVAGLWGEVCCGMRVLKVLYSGK